MSSANAAVLSTTLQDVDNPTLTLNANNNKLIIENNSPDLTISKFDTSTVPTASVPIKTQVLPLVYIQNHPKVPFGAITKPSSHTTNGLLQYNGETAPVQTNNVIFTPSKPQSVVIQKPMGKITGTYVTMLKPSSETNINVPEVQNGASKPQKIVFAPMPKVFSSGPPVTATTNAVQPKIAILPMPVPKSEPPVTKKVYNFQIADGKLQCDNGAPFTVIGDSEGGSNGTKMEVDSDSERNLMCSEVLDVESPPKNDVSDKSYELSITEESLSNQSDIRLVVSSIDEQQQLNGEKNTKETSKFTHGVSILKKNFSLTERKQENPVSVVNSEPRETHKPERRRKSQFSLRKDFDEMDITLEVKEEVKNEEEEDEDTAKGFLKTDANFDPFKVLKWHDNIGTLPGSNLKFTINEFDIIEFLTEEEYRKMVAQKPKKDTQEEIRCMECGCYGLRSDFISKSFCSYDCQSSGGLKVAKDDVRTKKKKKRIKTCDVVDTKPLEVKRESSEEDTSNDTNAERFTYPWACKKKGFSWSKYLEHVKAKPAPVKLFKDPFPYTRNGFRPGMKLEGVDPQHASYFCVLTVAEVVGYRMRLHFDGYLENYDFWLNADSMDIFPIGWCEKYGHVLQPPPGYTVENFNWIQYLKQTKATAAPKHLFTNRAGQAICPNGFRVGMKLEAVDRKNNTSLVCVATVRDMMDNRILVHFDSWDDIYDYWADPTSPYIHPVGWCDQYGHNLTPPNDYPSPETFSWEVYLKETKSVAAPVRAFKQRPACGFKRGMRLECVDKRVPQLIRVATVDDVKEHQIRIHFDGWPDRYSYWVDDDCPNIHPMSWCLKTGHPIEPPLTPDDVYDFLECPTVGCRGQGHVHGPKYPTHNSQKYCPYAEENIDVDKVLPDRLLSPDRNPPEVVPVSREPKECKIKPRIGRPPKYLKEMMMKNTETRDENASPSPPTLQAVPEKKPKRKYTKRQKTENPTKTHERHNAQTLIELHKRLPAEKESWEKHSRFLRDYIDGGENPLTWTMKEVVDFVASLPGCNDCLEGLIEENIDGESLLLLSQKDILTVLKMKVGPAVKLYNTIVLLRQQFIQDKTFM